MITLAPGVRVYLALGATDMRKAINGLSALASGQLGLNAFSGHVFAFSNRKRTMIKLLVWDRNGFWLLQKRLEKQRFRWPKTEGEVQEMSVRELAWLLDGLDPMKTIGHRKLEYSTLF